MDSQEGTPIYPFFLRVAVQHARALQHQLGPETAREQLIDAGLDADTVALLLDGGATDGRMTVPKQPDPQPSFALSEQTPSLLLYVTLAVLAGILIVVAFSAQQPDPDWAGLSVNLATEIIGAVVILIVVDRRLRSSELRAIRESVESSASWITSLLSPDVRATLSYAKALDFALKMIRPEPYFERSDFESLLEEQPKGFLLHGEAGSGKTALLQSIAITQNEKAIRHPRSERIPVIIPAMHWSDGTLTDRIWRETRRYSKLGRGRLRRWLESGRLIVILDGLDEAQRPEDTLAKVEDFRAQYPSTSLVASCRSHFLSHATLFLDLETIEMPSLTEDEAAAFIRLVYGV